jgi:hypothetical protein
VITRRTTSARYRRHIATYGEDDCGVYCYQCSRRYFIDDTIGDKCPRCHGQVTCLVVIDPCEADLTDPDLAWLADDDTPAPPAIPDRRRGRSVPPGHTARTLRDRGAGEIATDAGPPAVQVHHHHARQLPERGGAQWQEQKQSYSQTDAALNAA